MGVYEELCSLVDMEFPPMVGVDAVCPQMIRHWCEAMQEDNPLYLDEEYARRSKYGSIISPPAMTPSWVIPPLWPPSGMPPIYEKLFGICGRGGYDQVIDSENEMHFLRPLFPGDRVQSSTKVSRVSSMKSTALGTGFFVALESGFANQRQESICRQRMTMYMYEGHGAKPNRLQPLSLDADLTTWHSAQESNSPWNIGASGAGGPLPDKPLQWKDVKPGDDLPACTRLMTTTTVIAAAVASRDFAPMHHDLRAARNAGVRDIFVNYLTSGGLAAKYLTDWSRPCGELRHIRFNLMTPCCAGDTLTLTGTVRGKSVVKEEPCVNVGFSMGIEEGPHCRGEAMIALPQAGE
jgi:acyl dehydratase